jgi:hypothetical protein
MGLIGVANGIDGDLRPGLPSQMIEVHDPVRLLAVVEHYPEVVKKAISKNPATYEWYKNEWLRLAVIHPETKQIFVFEQEEFIEYQPIQKASHIENELALAEKTKENLPVGILTNAKCNGTYTSIFFISAFTRVSTKCLFTRKKRKTNFGNCFRNGFYSICRIGSFYWFLDF